MLGSARHKGSDKRQGGAGRTSPQQTPWNAPKPSGHRGGTGERGRKEDAQPPRHEQGRTFGPQLELGADGGTREEHRGRGEGRGQGPASPGHPTANTNYTTQSAEGCLLNLPSAQQAGKPRHKAGKGKRKSHWETKTSTKFPPRPH